VTYSFPSLPVIDHAGATLNFEQLQTTITELQERAGGSGGSGWIKPELKNSWVAVETTPGYRRVGSEVFLRGQIKGGNNLTSAFTLPAGYRPPQRWWGVGYASGGLVAGVIIESSGEVIIAYGGTSGKEQTTLDPISFLVD
jgi:hypothetical protein